MDDKYFIFSKQSILYVLVGAMLSLTGYLSYAGLHLIFSGSVSYLFLYLASYAIMVIVSYVTYSKWVFKSRLALGGLARYFLATQLNAWLSLVILVVAAEVLFVPTLYAPLVPLIFLTPMMFLLSKKYIFTQKGKELP